MKNETASNVFFCENAETSYSYKTLEQCSVCFCKWLCNKLVTLNYSEYTFTILKLGIYQLSVSLCMNQVLYIHKIEYISLL